MKRINYALLAFVTIAATLTLAGCGDSKQISEVKGLPFNLVNSIDLPQNLTVDQALDNRKVCNHIKWTTDKDNQGETIVTYRCDYKGVDDSLFVKNSGLDVESAGDVYQWTYGRDDKPALTAVAAIINQKGGKSVDIAPGQSVNYTIWLAFHDTAKNFDEAYSQLTGKAVPPPPEATKSASPIPDTTYGNKLAQFFPGQQPLNAAIHAYLQKGISQSVHMQRIDSLGYLELEDSSEARAAVYPVDPADVQIALKVDPYTIHDTGIGPPDELQDNKLVCLNEVCYNKNGHLVGKAPPEVVAKETRGATVDQFGRVLPNAQVQQSVQAVQASSQQAMQQAVQQDTGLPTGSDDDWPAMTPCIKKLDDAYVKAAQAQDTDETVSIDQMKEWASTCKALGQ